MIHIGYDLTEEEWTKIAQAFIRKKPIDVDIETGEPKYTDKQWVMLHAMRAIEKVAVKGAKLLRLDQVEPIDTGLMTDIVERNI